jgi:hypothetical protein
MSLWSKACLMATCPKGHEVNLFPTERYLGSWYCRYCETHYPKEEWIVGQPEEKTLSIQ